MAFRLARISRNPCVRWEGRVGLTPMVDLTFLAPKGSIAPGVKVLGKCEFANPSGSIKDRIVRHMLDSAEREGRLKKGDTVVAASSGNTAAALAMFSAIRGYKSILITNRKTSEEKINALYAYGAEVVISESGVGPDHPEHYQNVENRMVAENPGYFGLNQYDNPMNPDAYFRTLGPEIWTDTSGKITHFVAAGSTGGTISGTMKFLKMMNPNIVGVMPDPHGSIFYEYWASGVMQRPGKFLVEGVGKDSIPGAMNFNMVDMMPRFTDKEAFSMCRHTAREAGMMIGGSAGGNLYCALKLAQTLEKGTVVAILCDNGIKYLSKIFNDDWMIDNVGSLGNTCPLSIQGPSPQSLLRCSSLPLRSQSGVRLAQRPSA